MMKASFGLSTSHNVLVTPGYAYDFPLATANLQQHRGKMHITVAKMDIKNGYCFGGLLLISTSCSICLVVSYLHWTLSRISLGCIQIILSFLYTSCRILWLSSYPNVKMHPKQTTFQNTRVFVVGVSRWSKEDWFDWKHWHTFGWCTQVVVASGLWPMCLRCI